MTESCGDRFESSLDFRPFSHVHPECLSVATRVSDTFCDAARSSVLHVSTRDGASFCG
jgi:hypothetical protein